MTVPRREDHAAKFGEAAKRVLESAAQRPGGELAVALINVMAVLNRWPDEHPSLGLLTVTGASDDILTAIERGLRGERS